MADLSTDAESARTRWNREHPDRVALHRKRAYEKNKAKIKAQRAVRDKLNAATLAIAAKERRRRYPTEGRNIQLKLKFGIDLQKYNEMLTEQNGLCKICKRPQSEFRRAFAVDHDHTTGKIRGLLCGKCNTAIGSLGDSVELLQRAISYLESYR